MWNHYISRCYLRWRCLVMKTKQTFVRIWKPVTRYSQTLAWNENRCISIDIYGIFYVSEQNLQIYMFKSEASFIFCLLNMIEASKIFYFLAIFESVIIRNIISWFRCLKCFFPSLYLLSTVWVDGYMMCISSDCPCQEVFLLKAHLNKTGNTSLPLFQDQ